jgi:hypothetical protein
MRLINESSTVSCRYMYLGSFTSFSEKKVRETLNKSPNCRFIHEIHFLAADKNRLFG